MYQESHHIWRSPASSTLACLCSSNVGGGECNDVRVTEDEGIPPVFLAKLKIKGQCKQETLPLPGFPTWQLGKQRRANWYTYPKSPQLSRISDAAILSFPRLAPLGGLTGP